jgi:hypothetical protein
MLSLSTNMIFNDSYSLMLLSLMAAMSATSGDSDFKRVAIETRKQEWRGGDSARVSGAM